MGDVRYDKAEKGSYTLALFGERAQEVTGSSEEENGKGLRNNDLAAKKKHGKNAVRT